MSLPPARPQHDPQGTKTTRIIWPIGVGSSIHIAGWCETKKDFFSFRTKPSQGRGKWSLLEVESTGRCNTLIF
jgi:hypothetical protein